MKTNQMQGGQYLRMTLDEFNAVFCKERASGNTTRLADFFVQALFNNIDQWVHISDNLASNQFQMDRRLVNIIKTRLIVEHQIDNKQLKQLVCREDGRREILLLKLEIHKPISQ